MREKRQPLKPPIAATATESQPSEDGWLTTRQAYDLLQPQLGWNTFRKLSAEQLQQRFNLQADPSRKIQGKTDSQWLQFQAATRLE